MELVLAREVVAAAAMPVPPVVAWAGEPTKVPRGLPEPDWYCFCASACSVPVSEPVGSADALVRMRVQR
jgi:hypothetical protein